MTKTYVKKGKTNHLIIMLHGTGGNESDLKEIAGYLDPLASLIGIRGRIQENGMNRYFERQVDGTFIQESLEQETRWLFDTLNDNIQFHGGESPYITVLGYSNGANIAYHLLRNYKTAIHQYILLHPSPGIVQTPSIDLQGTEIILTGGNADPFCRPDEFQLIFKTLNKMGAKVTPIYAQSGHQITQYELEEIKKSMKRG